MKPDNLPTTAGAGAKQKLEFRNGDEAAALAARHLGSQWVEGHPAFFHGAALGGLRACGSVRGEELVRTLDQLAVQAAERLPMVLNLAAGPDHSALYRALDAGWIVLCARDPQAVYDLNLAAVKIGEHPDVRLPVLIAYDGFVTSFQKRRVFVLDDAAAVAAFAGARSQAATPLDPSRPATFGAPMDGSSLIRHKAQLSAAMDAARAVIPAVLGELAALTGRSHPVIDAYAMEEAEAALLLLNSGAEAAKEAIDVWRGEGRKVGVISPNVLRPFPADDLRQWLRGVKAATVADRGGACGTGNLSVEVRAALQPDTQNRTRILARIHGGELAASDAEKLLDEAYKAATTDEPPEPFAYHGAVDGAPVDAARRSLPPIRGEEAPRGMATVRRNEKTGRLEVELAPLWKMTAVPQRIAPGHGACPGCGAMTMLHQAFKVLEGNIVALFENGCAAVVTTAYPATAHRINCIYDAAGNGAATLSGLVEAYRERVRRAELPPSGDVTFVMITGDGAMDAGLAEAIAAANRNARLLILEYDNQGRMAAGGASTHSTPLGHGGKTSHHRDTAQLFAACHVPYVFTACEGHPEDLMRKVAKAQWYVKNEGLAYGKVLSFCPLHWETADDAAQPVLQAAIDSCFFPLYEVERGHTTITYDPDAVGRRKPVAEWLRLMGKTRGLLESENEALVARLQAETDRRWARLKAMHDHPLL